MLLLGQYKLACVATVFKRLQYNIRIFLGIAAIPRALRIHNNAGSQLAAVKASCVINTCVLQPHFLGFGFHIGAQFFGTFLAAAATAVAGFTRIGAAENMILEKAHYFAPFPTASEICLKPSRSSNVISPLLILFTSPKP